MKKPERACALVGLAVVLGLGWLSAGCQSRNQAPADAVTVASALNDLTNLWRLAMAPQGVMATSSSYDRTGGNEDGHHFVAWAADGKPLLADLKGPGVVRRMWFTGMPAQTRLFFAFDNEPAPRFSATFDELKGKGGLPLTPPLTDDPSGGAILYLPLPYAQRLVITAEVPPDKQFFFYQINHEAMPAGTPVESFTPERATAALAAFAGLPVMRNPAMLDLAGEDSRSRVTVNGGIARELASLSGPAVVTSLQIELECPEGISEMTLNRFLRRIVLRIYWDDAKDPSVEVPLGDFFCNGVRPVSFDSLPMSGRNLAFECRFPMPFRKSMRIEAINGAAFRMTLPLTVRKQALAAWDNRLRYFHAAWSQSRAGGQRHNLLSVHSAGHYVGAYVVAIGTDGSWNILESDERMFRDGEKEPALHGTGLEDYFNGAWYYNYGTFVRPFAGCLEKSGIRTTQYRFHVPDPVGFKRSFNADIEFGHGNTSRGYMSSVAYYYLDKPAPAAFRVPEVTERFPGPDPLEPGSMLCEVFERERLGLTNEAMSLCREYTEKYPKSTESELMILRGLAYRLHAEGFNAVSNLLVARVQASTSPEVRQQAELLIGLNQSRDAGLLAVHANAAYKLYVDDRLIMEGNDPITAAGRLISLPPGRHVIAVEASSPRPDPWFSAHLRGHGWDLWTDDTWRVSRQAPAGWRDVAFDDTAWRPASAGGPLPWMRWFQFRPNAFVFAHFRKQLLGHPDGWGVNQSLFFRKTIDIPPY